MKRLIVCRAVLFTAALLGLFGLAELALAQVPDAGHKIRGDYSGRAMRSARDYSREYRTYAKSAPKADKEVAQETADSIGQYITKAQKHMAWMRKNAIKATDKESLAMLDVIDKNLAEAAKEHHTLHGCCAKETLDVALSMKCCEEIDKSLDKAIAEHDKLMKRLGLATAPDPARK